MTKRLFWLLTGFGLGVALTRRFRRRTGSGATRVGLGARARAQLDDAVAEGRREMEQREATLREVFAAPRSRDTGR
jgi:hypothetical protein